jgi:hydrogenase maturation factor HypF (carbamoyltransferase family)
MKPNCRCQRCHEAWHSPLKARTHQEPIQCPRCKRVDWNRPLKRGPRIPRLSR